MSQSRKKLRSKTMKTAEKNISSRKTDSDSQTVLKKLDNLHSKTRMEQRTIKTDTTTNIKLLGVIIIIVIGMSGFLILDQLDIFGGSTPNTGGGEPSPNPPVLFQTIGGFMKDNASTPIYIENKVSVVFESAEFCPFCGLERWAIVMALSEFGTFSGLSQIVTNEYNVPSYTFYGSTYSSTKVHFEPVELSDLNGKALESPNALQSSLISRFNTKNTVPFLCLGGTTFRNGVGPDLNVQDFNGKTFTEVKTQVDAKSGPGYDQFKAESY